MLVSNGMLAGGTDAAGIEAAISSCAVGGTAAVAGGLFCAVVLGPALDPDVALSGSGIDDGVVSPIVALVAGATLGVGSLGRMLALTGIVGAGDGAVSFGAALVTGAGAAGFTAGISIGGSPEFTGAGAASAAGGGAASAAGDGPGEAGVEGEDFAAPFLAGVAACCAG